LAGKRQEAIEGRTLRNDPGKPGSTNCTVSIGTLVLIFISADEAPAGNPEIKRAIINLFIMILFL
jgi:hypothetical protein